MTSPATFGHTAPRPPDFHRDLVANDGTVRLQRINSDGTGGGSRRCTADEAQRILVAERYVPVSVTVRRCEFRSMTAGYTYGIVITP